MDSKQTSPMFDARVAAALVAGPIVPIILYSHAQPLLIPSVVIGFIAQIALPHWWRSTRNHFALAAGLLGFKLVAFALTIAKWGPAW